jgi:hypothetical protein
MKETEEAYQAQLQSVNAEKAAALEKCEQMTTATTISALAGGETAGDDSLAERLRKQEEQHHEALRKQEAQHQETMVAELAKQGQKHEETLSNLKGMQEDIADMRDAKHAKALGAALQASVAEHAVALEAALQAKEEHASAILQAKEEEWTLVKMSMPQSSNESASASPSSSSQQVAMQVEVPAAELQHKEREFEAALAEKAEQLTTAQEQAAVAVAEKEAAAVEATESEEFYLQQLDTKNAELASMKAKLSVPKAEPDPGPTAKHQEQGRQAENEQARLKQELASLKDEHQEAMGRKDRQVKDLQAYMAELEIATSESIAASGARASEQAQAERAQTHQATKDTERAAQEVHARKMEAMEQQLAEKDAELQAIRMDGGGRPTTAAESVGEVASGGVASAEVDALLAEKEAEHTMLMSAAMRAKEAEHATQLRKALAEQQREQQAHQEQAQQQGRGQEQDTAAMEQELVKLRELLAGKEEEEEDQLQAYEAKEAQIRSLQEQVQSLQGTVGQSSSSPIRSVSGGVCLTGTRYAQLMGSARDRLQRHRLHCEKLQKQVQVQRRKALNSNPQAGREAQAPQPAVSEPVDERTILLHQVVTRGGDWDTTAKHCAQVDSQANAAGGSAFILRGVVTGWGCIDGQQHGAGANNCRGWAKVRWEGLGGASKEVFHRIGDKGLLELATYVVAPSIRAPASTAQVQPSQGLEVDVGAEMVEEVDVLLELLALSPSAISRAASNCSGSPVTRGGTNLGARGMLQPQVVRRLREELEAKEELLRVLREDMDSLASLRHENASLRSANSELERLANTIARAPDELATWVQQAEEASDQGSLVHFIQQTVAPEDDIVLTSSPRAEAAESAATGGAGVYGANVAGGTVGTDGRPAQQTQLAVKQAEYDLSDQLLMWAGKALFGF